MRENLTKHDFLILWSLVAVGLTGHYLNSGSMSTPFIYIEALLALLAPWRSIRLFILLSVFLAASMAEVAIYFGFSGIFVALHALIINFQHLGLFQIILISFGIFIISFIILASFVISAKPVNRILHNTVFFSVIPISIGLYQAERYAFTGLNLIGRIPYESFDVRGFDEIRVIERTNRHFALNPNTTGAENIYVFVMESLGVFASNDINKYFVNLIENESGRNVVYKVERQFSQGTLGGELREFCGFRTNHLNINRKIPEFESCIPNLLKSEGWRTTVIHPGPRGIYNRPIIYDAIGFEKYISAENFKNVESCGGGWAGAPCDSLIIANKLDGYIESDKKNLLYYLSINSHHPYTNNMQEIKVCKKFQISIGPECSYFSHLMSNFKSIGEFIRKNKGYYYITGDHSPPGLAKLVKIDMIPVYEINSLPD